MTETAKSRDLSFALLVKRTVDVVASGVGLVFLAPLMLLTALAIKLESRGPILFSQERVGLGGKRIRILKFRTMRMDQGQIDQKTFLEEIIADKGQAADLQGRMLKLTRDPRMTHVGRFLRRFDFDGLPQFINVLKGDLSLVGPRPALPFEAQFYDERQRHRFDVKPGLTGLGQIMAYRSNATFDLMVNFDLEYINNWNLWLDIKIMLRTMSYAFRGAASV